MIQVASLYLSTGIIVPLIFSLSQSKKLAFYFGRPCDTLDKVQTPLQVFEVLLQMPGISEIPGVEMARTAMKFADEEEIAGEALRAVADGLLAWREEIQEYTSQHPHINNLVCTFSSALEQYAESVEEVVSFIDTIDEQVRKFGEHKVVEQLKQKLANMEEILDELIQVVQMVMEVLPPVPELQEAAATLMAMLLVSKLAVKVTRKVLEIGPRALRTGCRLTKIGLIGIASALTTCKNFLNKLFFSVELDDLEANLDPNSRPETSKRESSNAKPRAAPRPQPEV